MEASQVIRQAPFDILGVIFSYYADEETIEYPLETLLLVSRSWAHAALNHRTLWGTLRVYLGHEPIPTMWSARIPLRLARCGPNIPLDIDLRNILDAVHLEGIPDTLRGHNYFVSECPWPKPYPSEQCDCHRAARLCFHQAMTTLKRNSGELFARCKRLNLDQGRGYLAESGSLSWSTPILTSLTLKGIRLSRSTPSAPPFSEATLLRRITVLDCDIPLLPSFENVLEATVGWIQSHGLFHDFPPLRNATRLQNLYLCLITTAEIPLPAQLSDLRSLRIKINGARLPSDLHICELPQLSSLRVEFIDGGEIRQLLSCRGLLIGNLTSITFEWNPMTPRRNEIAELAHSLLELLGAAGQLRELSGNGNLMSILIKLLWDIRLSKSRGSTPQGDPASTILRDCRLTNLDDEKVLKLSGMESKEALEALAKQWNCITPELPWNRFVKQLRVGISF